MRDMPSRPPSKWFQVRATPELHDALDAVRRGEPDLPDKSTMIRRLIERAARRLRKSQ